MDKIAEKLFPGITKHMKENKLYYWHGKSVRHRKGKYNPFFGKKHSEETRRKWSILRSDPKNRLCRSFGMLGKKHSEASKEKTRQTIIRTLRRKKHENGI